MPPRHGVFRVAIRLWRHLDRQRRHQFGFLCLVIGLSAISEVVSLGALFPFIGILTSPSLVLNHPRLAGVLSASGITAADQLVLPLAVLFAIAAVIAATLRLLVLWSTSRLAHGISGDFGTEMYRRTLYQPYSVHVARNSSSVLTGITHKVDDATRMLMGQLTLVSDLILLLVVTATLMAVHPVVAALAGCGFGGSYALTSWVARRRLRRNGLLIAREQTNIVKVVREGLGGIRDVLLDWTQPVYADMYRKANASLRRAASENELIKGAPRSVMEAAGIVLIVGLAYWLSGGSGGFSAALPVLGVLAFGAQRLLPMLQRVYDSWSSITITIAPVSEVLDMLDQPLPPEAHLPVPAPLTLQHGVSFEGVRFSYTKDAPWVLNGLTLSIPRGIRMGVVGATGSGKSTLLDLLTGLLTATEGVILVDGVPLAEDRLRAWQRSVAHVPQSIYLADSTIAENIAFGCPSHAIDMDRVRQAAVRAQIADFIESRPDGYGSRIGERGIRLSGGQRQRVGIARALYKQGSVLVFDEATSALDNATEQSVMDTIEALDRGLTVIIIAHRVTTVRRCDRFVELIGGRAVEYQSYEQMLERSPSARQAVVAI